MRGMEENIKKILNKYEVVLGYIFGSHARGTAGSLSDIDVAVALPFGLSDEEQAEKIGNIRGEIQQAFKTDYVDVINLMQNENSALRHDIIFGGKAVLNKDQNLKTFLELKTVKDFEDTRYLRDMQFRILKEKIYVTD